MQLSNSVCSPLLSLTLYPCPLPGFASVMKIGHTLYDTGILHDHTLKRGKLGPFLFSQAILINSTITEINNVCDLLQQLIEREKNRETKSKQHPRVNLTFSHFTKQYLFIVDVP